MNNLAMSASKAIPVVQLDSVGGHRNGLGQALQEDPPDCPPARGLLRKVTHTKVLRGGRAFSTAERGNFLIGI